MPHIFLYGPPGAGKTSIGKMLARNLKLPFIDLDRAIETNASTSIQQMMESQGESAFREMETAALMELAINASTSPAPRLSSFPSQRGESVVALGGGALLRDQNRELAENNGTVVTLMAELDTLLERLNSDSNKRPLLAGDLREKLESLLENRGEHYSSFPLLLHVDGKTPEQAAQHIQIALGRHHLSAMGEYDVIVQNNGVEQIGGLLLRRGVKNPIVVTDENVAKFHAEKVVASLRSWGFNPNVLTIPAGETHKNLNTIGQLWHGFLEAGLDRKSTVVALGGGVVNDLAGFAASTFMRGVEWVSLPTTLLSMVDASLGGKTGFDLPEGKNLIGSFYSPKLVLADPQLIKTLPNVELISGLAEVVKHGIISDPQLFNLCARGLDWVKDHLEEIIKRAMAVKIQIIENDPYENGFRATLNLGHTVGHAVELVSRFNLRHGEAVAMGLVAEAKLAESLMVASGGVSDVVAESLSALHLPIHIPEELPRGEIIHAMGVDKKQEAHVVRFALPVKIGKVELVDVTNLEMVFEQ